MHEGVVQVYDLAVGGGGAGGVVAGAPCTTTTTTVVTTATTTATGHTTTATTSSTATTALAATKCTTTTPMAPAADGNDVERGHNENSSANPDKPTEENTPATPRASLFTYVYSVGLCMHRMCVYRCAKRACFGTR